MPNISFRGIYSSHVAQIGYAPETQELHVIWDSGKRSVYSGVPQPLATSTMNAASVGGSLHKDIKPNYPHRYI
jgi:hypothetical protein